MSPSYSRLAWEFAQHATFTTYKGQRRATLTLENGDQVHGFGRTNHEARERLASALMVLA